MRGAVGERIVKLVILDECPRRASAFLRGLAVRRAGGSRADRKAGDEKDAEDGKRALGPPDRLSPK